MKKKKSVKNIAVIGLGYVGLPLAEAFSHKYQVVGFDTDQNRIDAYLNGKDPTEMVGDRIADAAICFTSNEKDISNADVFIITVPTPVKEDKRPDMGPLQAASEIVGRHLDRGSIVVYESTVYPGATEDVCVPILEQASGYSIGKDFTVGYSPERINPGDRVHQLKNVVKIVSGSDEETTEILADLYGDVVEAGVYRAGSIKVAEAAKLAENSQRDLNIAFVNELAMVLNLMDIPVGDVIDAMNTKWNALGFRPGLVGGHCIGVDPYYFVHKAEKLGYHNGLVLAGRKINDSMGRYIAERIVKELSAKGLSVKNARIAILGVTFKEDCKDLRNTGVLNIFETLKSYGAEPIITDPVADNAEVGALFGCSLKPLEQIYDVDCVVLAVAHKDYLSITEKEYERFFEDRLPEESLIIDVKGMANRVIIEEKGYSYWSLT